MKTLIRILCVLVVATLHSSIVRAGTPTEQDISRGAADYVVACSSCHGLSAKGDGLLSDLLKVRPKDLTRIARRSGGEFPLERIRRIIDGRADVRSHGMREMPVWGLSFQDPGRADDQEAEVRERIDRVIAFLQSIQEPPPGTEERRTSPR
jgi:hypothetical protein